MSALEWSLLALAGAVGGLAGSIAGLASLVSYPALLAVGLPPVTANVTNTVALVFSSVGSVSGSQPELKGQGARLLPLGIAAVLGGIAGAGLLLLTPDAAFERIAPWLIGGASATLLLRPRPRADDERHDRAGLGAGVFLVAIYGGYFGAAAGVLLLALLLTATRDALATANAVKNVLLGLANAVAALGFIVLAPVEWSAAVPLAIGLLVGGRVGPIIVRHAPADALRMLIGAAGIALAIKLGIDAYG